ncbi:MAG: PorT family protein [Muribaculaceae bacterium]|nr:PorT family protein [Muribaculaceae bacterium]
MNQTKLRHIALWIMLVVMGCAVSHAQDNDMILNRPYADSKPLHFGFSVGMNFQNLAITNNGHLTSDGEEWYADVPAHSPGFSVNVLADYRIAEHFNIRVSPGLFFGNKVVKFLNYRGSSELPDQTQYKQSQNIKSTYIVVPFDLKMSAKRYHNMRPYFTAGAMYTGDLSKDRSEQLKLKNSDVMLTVGMGCDFYMPFFKLCPEIKFCFGLKDMLDRNRPDLVGVDDQKLRFTESVSKIKSNMVVVTFFFE